MRAYAKTVPGFQHPPPSVLPPRDLCHFAPILAVGPLIKGTDGAEAIWSLPEALRRKQEDPVMMNFDTERLIGETMAEVLRERLIELETLEATGDASEHTVSRLAFVRKLLARFDEHQIYRPQASAQLARLDW